jgi:hypothetical protein
LLFQIQNFTVGNHNITGFDQSRNRRNGCFRPRADQQIGTIIAFPVAANLDAVGTSIANFGFAFNNRNMIRLHLAFHTQYQLTDNFIFPADNFTVIETNIVRKYTVFIAM